MIHPIESNMEQNSLIKTHRAKQSWLLNSRWFSGFALFAFILFYANTSFAQTTPTITGFTIPSPQVFTAAPGPTFTITDPVSNSSGAFTYTSSRTSVATISGNTVTVVGIGNTTITATQAASGSYASGAVTFVLVVYNNSSPETPTPLSIPFTETFGSAVSATLPTGFVAWATSFSDNKAAAEASVPFAKAGVSTQTTTLATSATPTGTVYSYSPATIPTAFASVTTTFPGIAILVKGGNSPQLAFAINTLGKSDIRLTYDVFVQNAGAAECFVTQYRIGNSGNWTTIEGGTVSTNSTGKKSVNLLLPSACNNRANVQLRLASWAPQSCIFIFDNISVQSENIPINTPTATDITHNSAKLGATIAANANAISERGTAYSTSTTITETSNGLAEGGTDLSSFSHVRSGLSPETTYYYKGYGITSSVAFLTSETSSFITLSAPPTTATSNNTATAKSESSIDLSWTAATFPGSGASAKGYLVLMSPDAATPTLTNGNAASPTPDANTTILATLTGTETSYSVSGLSSFTPYKFKIVPFTWDGTNTTTYNYFDVSTLETIRTTTFSGPPEVSTVPLTQITHNSVKSGGENVKTGGGQITSRGVVWATTTNPTVSNNKVEFGAGNTDYESTVSGLTPQTQYHIRAYVENNAGLAYGSNLAFRTLSSPVTSQASSLTATGNNTAANKIDFNWTAAVFPGSGATVKGYLLLSAVAPNTPTLNSINGQAPVAGVNTTIVNSTILGTATSFTSTNLNNNVSYNFIMVPYTWDGTNASTYNYLTQSAPTASSVKLPTISASGSVALCTGEQVILSSNSASGNTWFKNGSAISGANGQQLTVTESGSYTVRVNWGSVSTTSAATQVNVYARPVPAISSSNGTKISKGFSTQLTARDGVTYKWTPNIYQWIDNPNIANPTVRPDVTTTFTVEVTNANGCKTSESITIDVVNDYQVTPQTMLTPNGDGKNDVWIIKNIDAFPDNEVKVLDQTGREVFRKKRYNNSWDGTYNGGYLPTGTYLYVIYFGDQNGLVKGNLTILR